MSTQPALYGRSDGIVHLENYRIWKHTIPIKQVHIPSSAASGAVTLFATIRDPFSWLASMSRHPYEMFSSRGWTRKLNSLEWLLQEVSIQTDSSFHNPHPDQEFASAIEVWATYAKGYLNGNIAPGGDTDRIVLVRYEDIRLRIQLVV